MEKDSSVGPKQNLIRDSHGFLNFYLWIQNVELLNKFKMCFETTRLILNNGGPFHGVLSVDARDHFKRRAYESRHCCS